MTKTTLRQHRRDRLSEGRDFSFGDYVNWVTAGDARFPVTATDLGGGVQGESIGEDFTSLVQRVYKRNGVVFACMLVRQSIFAEVRFRFAQVRDGRLGKLFGTPDLAMLEQPFGPNTTTGELAVRMIQDVDLAGNFYGVARGGRLWRRRPDRSVLILDGDPAVDEFVKVVGLAYYPAGVMPGATFHTYLPEELVHWSPLPDPEAEYRGMSWLTPVLREIRADGAATDHKLEFFDNAATPQMIVKTPADVMTREQFDKFREDLQRGHLGRGNRHKTLYLVPGADATVVGRDFQQMEFSEIQGRDEDRIASAAGVPAAIVGLKESLQGSTLNAGNYGQARRRLADGTMRPLYRSAAGALGNVVHAPQKAGPAVLWYDDGQVAFFREDRKDAADIGFVKAQTVRQLVDAGFEPTSVIAATEAEDPSLLVHTGLYSVQLQEPGSTKLPGPGADPAAKPAK